MNITNWSLKPGVLANLLYSRRAAAETSLNMWAEVLTPPVIEYIDEHAKSRINTALSEYQLYVEGVL